MADKVYVGIPSDDENTVLVKEYGKRPRWLMWRLDIAKKSPTGLSWGYGGSGPHQLAIALLADCFNDNIARQWNHALVRDIISSFAMDKPFQLEARQLHRWLAARMVEQFKAEHKRAVVISCHECNLPTAYDPGEQEAECAMCGSALEI
jgi:hypothetical protein